MADFKTWETGGSGRKECPECHVYVGSARHVCACNYDFEVARQERYRRARFVRAAKARGIDLEAEEKASKAADEIEERIDENFEDGKICGVVDARAVIGVLGFVAAVLLPDKHPDAAHARRVGHRMLFRHATRTLTSQIGDKLREMHEAREKIEDMDEEQDETVPSNLFSLGTLRRKTQK